MMRQNIYIMAGLPVAMALAIGLISCDKDCPVCPPPVAEPVSDYNVYITGTYASEVYVYNTAQKAIVDSIYLGDSLAINDLAVTGDGSRLLIIKNKMYDAIPEELIILDVQTHDTVKMNTDFIKRMGYARIEVSHTGKYIAIYDTEIIAFLDGNTLQVLYTDTLRVHNGRFLPDDSRFYFSRSGASQGYIDLTQDFAYSFFKYTDNDGYSPVVWTIQPASNGAALYMFVRYSSASNWFVSYRPDLDSVGLWRFMGPPGGDLRISPDGKTILASDPGFITVDQMGSQAIIAVDVANDGLTLVSAGYTNDGTYGILAGDIAFTPDGKYAAIACEAGTGFGLLDMRTLRYTDVQRSPHGGATMDLVACQKLK